MMTVIECNDGRLIYLPFIIYKLEDAPYKYQCDILNPDSTITLNNNGKIFRLKKITIQKPYHFIWEI